MPGRWLSAVAAAIGVAVIMRRWLRVRLGEVDEIALDVSGTVIERLDAAPMVEDDTQDEDEPAAGPIAIALDVNEPEAAPGDNSAS